MEYKYLKDRGALAEGKPTAQTPPPAMTIAGFKPRLSRALLPNEHDIQKILRQGPDERVFEFIPQTMARIYGVFPLLFDGESLTLASVKKDNLIVQNELSSFLGLDVRFVAAPKAEIEAAIKRHYARRSDESVDSMICEFTDSAIDVSDLDEDAPRFGMPAPKSARTRPRQFQKGSALQAGFPPMRVAV